MNVFITGHAGFVGRYLAAHLSARHVVRGVDLPGCDVRDRRKLGRAISRARPDWIAHLAGQAFVPRSWENPQETFEINVIGTLNVLEAMRKLPKPARLLLVSTTEVYGEPKGVMTERTPLRPQSPYALSKLAAEELALAYANRYGLDVVVVRPSNHTGPGQSPAFAISDWARQIAGGATVLRVGNLNSFRDFTDVRCVVRAYESALRRGKSGEVYNIASQHAVQMKDLLAKLIALSGRKVKVEVDDGKWRHAPRQKLVISVHKFRRAARWGPQISMDQTLGDLLASWSTCAS
jgi:GDP-4-dehydro-6-deoxy-D-mannose reductase